MDREIIISTMAAPMLPQSTFEGYSSHMVESPFEVINRLLNESDEVLMLLIVITSTEYQDINRQLNFIPYHRVYYQLLILGSEEELGNRSMQRLYHITDFRTDKLTAVQYQFIIEKAFSVIDEFYDNDRVKSRYMSKLIDSHQDQEDLIYIGKSLSSEKDSDKLLRMILHLSKKITGADAGSIYLVEDGHDGQTMLRFKYSHTFSRDIPLEEFVINLDTRSIAGYVAVKGDVLNIPDAYKLPSEAPYTFNTFFDKENDYISRSMLVVPMRNHEDEIIGVIQLLNSKKTVDVNDKGEPGNEAFTLELETREDFDKYVVTFDRKYDSLLEAVASQAAIAIENNLLIKTIETQFEEFVKASVSAIESQDPATSGHSFRVAEICKVIAREVNNVTSGYLADYHFDETEIQELEYAALLHDFGKVYVDLSIYKKAKKLHQGDYNNLQLRIDYLYRYIELFYYRKEADLLLSGSRDEVQELAEGIRKERDGHLDKILTIKKRIEDLNEPKLTRENPGDEIEDIISQIKALHCLNLLGNEIDIITDDERMNLAISRGSLNDMERQEIESHVVHTYTFVSKIPWPNEYKRIPEIALRHHEKLDGSGYPGGLKGRESTLLQSRIMAIADIFDALAAKDRPYKKAVPIERVLEIIQQEADGGKLDPDLVYLFINRQLYQLIDLDAEG